MNLVKIEKKKYVSPQAKKKFSNILICLVFPLIGFLFLVAGSSLGNVSLFGDPLLNNNLMLTVVTVLLACFALNTNLNSGRMDFSLGAIGILGCVLAWVILPESIRHESYFPILLMLVAMVFGVIFGLISGFVFTWLKIPAIVVSLGMCLVYEGLASAFAKGDSSIYWTGDISAGLTPFVTNIWFIIGVIVIVGGAMLMILKYSKFGHDKLSILYGQKVAVDTGVNEIKNAIICYGLAGALIAMYTFVSSVNATKVTISTNLGSAMSVMQNFLPIFLGGLIAKHSNEVVGLVLGIISVSFFKEGLYRYGVDPSTINLIVSVLIFVVLTYMVNWTNWIRILKNKINEYKLSKTERKNKKEME